MAGLPETIEDIHLYCDAFATWGRVKQQCQLAALNTQVQLVLRCRLGQRRIELEFCVCAHGDRQQVPVARIQCPAL